MITWRCPHCGKTIAGLVQERIDADARRHLKKNHPEEERQD